MYRTACSLIHMWSSISVSFLPSFLWVPYTLALSPSSSADNPSPSPLPIIAWIVLETHAGGFPAITFWHTCTGPSGGGDKAVYAVQPGLSQPSEACGRITAALPARVLLAYEPRWWWMLSHALRRLHSPRVLYQTPTIPPMTNESHS